MKTPTFNEMNKNKQVLYLHPKMVSAVVFTLLMLIGVFITVLGFQNLKQNDEQELDYILSILERNIQQTLNNCYSATLTLALTIDKDGIPQDFDTVASKLMSQNQFIDVLQLVPGGVIEYVYPMEGNEVVIGYDILKDQLTEKEARQALESREMFFAGPMNLKQGGVAVIARLPIFKNNQFWGFSAVIIKLDKLLSLMDLNSVDLDGYHFQFSKINPNTAETQYFLESKTQGRVIAEKSFFFRQGEWYLTVSKTWKLNAYFGLLIILVLSICLASMSALLIFNLLKKPAELQFLVDKQETKLAEREQRLSAILEAVPDFLFVIDKRGEIVDFHGPKFGTVSLKPNQVLFRNIAEFMGEADEVDVIENISQVINNEQLILREYEFKQMGNVHSYEARFVKNSEQEALVVVRDITDRKNYIKAIEEQNLKLTEIAWMQSHSVRAPLARIMGLIACLKLESDDDVSREQLIQHIIDAAEELDAVIKEIVTKAENV